MYRGSQCLNQIFQNKFTLLLKLISHAYLILPYSNIKINGQLCNIAE